MTIRSRRSTLPWLLALAAACVHGASPLPLEGPVGSPLPGPVFTLPVGNATVVGPATAPVTLVAFVDYAEPDSAETESLFRRIRETWPEESRIAIKHFAEEGTPASKAAEAALAAGAQGRFWEMQDLLYARQGEFGDDDLVRHAGDLKLDIARFGADLGTRRFRAQVAADRAEGERLGLARAPVLYLNGRRVTGKPSDFGSFRANVEAELRSARLLLAQGLRPEFLYEQLTRNGLEAAPAGERRDEPPALGGRGPKPRPALPGRPGLPALLSKPVVDDALWAVELGDSYAKGPSGAKVTIVVFTDYQCPFCARAEKTVGELEQKFPGELRFVVKHNPLPFHAQAPLAAAAALAAGAQGKFWEMHAWLFANQRTLGRAEIERAADELGLDVAAFKARLEEGFALEIKADMDQAGKLGARGTPTFFLNGRMLRGAQPLATFVTAVEAEIARADLLLREGVPREALYDRLVAEGKAEAPPKPPAPPDPPLGSEVADVSELGDAPVRGPTDAKVTIVVWTDFECPFCQRAAPTVDSLLENHPKDVRLVFRHQPLAFHARALPAAIASEAARRQGKFWEFHDGLFAADALEEEDLVRIAGGIGLDLKRFEQDRADPAVKARVTSDSEAGIAVGADGTPTFFFNGRRVGGARPFASFETIVLEELAAADALLAAGTKREALYPALVKANLAKFGKAGGAAKLPDPDARVTIEDGRSPVRGPPGAPVTIVVFSEFQCPFCARVVPTIDALFARYPGKIRVVFKHLPLPFHDRAVPAALVSLEAHDQGRFWELHDRLFKGQAALADADLEKYAREVKLDVAKIKAAAQRPELRARLAEDQALAERVGATGTPTFFVNGRRLNGAQPIEAFQALIDEELAGK